LASDADAADEMRLLGGAAAEDEGMALRKAEEAGEFSSLSRLERFLVTPLAPAIAMPL
jgi:hypothetical protein